jgi:hypothetical protein
MVAEGKQEGVTSKNRAMNAIETGVEAEINEMQGPKWEHGSHAKFRKGDIASLRESRESVHQYAVYMQTPTYHG